LFISRNFLLNENVKIVLVADNENKKSRMQLQPALIFLSAQLFN